MAERTRIAREMHDVLAHRISLVALHAGALEIRPDLPPEKVRETAELLRSTARQALEELRGVIGVLREEPGQEPTPAAPQPTLSDIPRLVEETRRAGAKIDFDMQVDRPDAAPSVLGRDAYRIVQEALTNIGKHARGTAGQVRVTGAADSGLRVSVRNRLPVHPQVGPALPGSGEGLLGLQERVTLAGGTLIHGPDRIRRLPGGRRVAVVRVRVLLVDDDALVRAALRTILSSAEDLDVVGEADDGTRAVAAVREHRPDVVLMDIRMPEMDGITATAALRRLEAPPQVIVLTTFQADEQVMSALRAGAGGFLLKDTPPVEILNAIRVVASGEAMLSPSVTRTLLSHFGDNEASARRRFAGQRLATLTDREREVAVGSGASNAEVAASLFMSEATVKAHVSRLLSKLDVANRVQIAIVVHDADQS
jgi:DNA-binding NarL/FixJ family response regulator